MKSAHKEIWRLRLNWMFYLITPLLTGIAVNRQVSYHQFITNPSQEMLMEANNTLEIEPGLGLSELFYSWSIAAMNIGWFAGALLAGFLVKILPYSAVTSGVILAHTLGYVLYALATEGWMMIFARLLSGIYIGAEFTLAPAYFSASYYEYLAAQKELGEKKTKKFKEKDILNAAHSVAMAIGTAVGIGAAAVIAQLGIPQFRMIGWTNAATGIVVLLIEAAIFREESRCKKINRPTSIKYYSLKNKSRMQIHYVGLFIVSFLVIVKGTRSLSYQIYETMYNPILSDQFGFSEKYQAYVFFVLAAPQIAGAILVFILQGSGLNNRIVVVIGMLCVLSGAILLADWQAIPSDHCTEYSPFHHPELIDNYTAEFRGAASYDTDNIQADVCFPSGISLFDSSTMKHLLKCSEEPVDSCVNCINEDVTTAFPAPSVLCFSLGYRGDKLRVIENGYIPLVHKPAATYECRVKNSEYCACVTTAISGASLNGSHSVDLQRLLQSAVHIKSLEVIEENVYNLAVNKCESQPNCHWIPQSRITGKLCVDCPPICRSMYHTLTFVQFCIGAVLLKISLPTGRVSAVNLITDIVDKDIQSIVIGIGYATAAMIGITSPPWLVESYEVTKKRTFLMCFLFIFISASVLLGILVLYPKLGMMQSIFKSPKGENSTKKGESQNARESETDEDTNEQTKLSADLEN